jgi:hypothetical protein
LLLASCSALRSFCALLETFIELADLGFRTDTLQGTEYGAPEVVTGYVHLGDNAGGPERSNQLTAKFELKHGAKILRRL